MIFSCRILMKVMNGYLGEWRIVLLTIKMNLFFDGDDLTWNLVSRAVGAHDPSYLTKTSRNSSPTFVRGKGVATNSATFVHRSTHQVLVHDDDEIEEDIGEYGDYGLDGDGYFEDDGDLE
ncbi:hypothetical protein V6N13_072814 [Hibiscus sabdariffa]